MAGSVSRGRSDDSGDRCESRESSLRPVLHQRWRSRSSWQREVTGQRQGRASRPWRVPMDPSVDFDLVPESQGHSPVTSTCLQASGSACTSWTSCVIKVSSPSGSMSSCGCKSSKMHWHRLLHDQGVCRAALPGLLLIGLLWLGACAGRLVGVNVDGNPGLWGWVAGGMELVFGGSLVTASLTAHPEAPVLPGPAPAPQTTPSVSAPPASPTPTAQP